MTSGSESENTVMKANRHRVRTRARAFTLLEVLMVVVIIGLLAAFVVPSFFGAGDKARQDLRSLRNQTLTNLETTWSAFALAQDQIRVQHAFLEADKQRKAEYDVLYRSGLMSFQEWILVVQEYVNFQTSYLRSEQNLILAEAQWRFATGETLGD